MVWVWSVLLVFVLVLALAFGGVGGIAAFGLLLATIVGIVVLVKLARQSFKT